MRKTQLFSVENKKSCFLCMYLKRLTGSFLSDFSKFGWWTHIKIVIMSIWRLKKYEKSCCYDLYTSIVFSTALVLGLKKVFDKFFLSFLNFFAKWPIYRKTKKFSTDPKLSEYVWVVFIFQYEFTYNFAEISTKIISI